MCVMEQSVQMKGFYGDLATYNETVLDISDSTKDFFSKRHPAYTRSLIGVTIIAVIVSLFFLPFLILAIAIPIIAYWRVRVRMAHLFYTQLATIIGMTYEPSSDRSTVSGYFFSVGRGGPMANVLTGIYEGAPIRLYEYQFVTGSGKHKQTHPFIVSEIDTGGTLPRVFMKPEGFSVFGKPSGTKLLSLEGNFNEHFDVYVPEDSEIEALQILEPDVMVKLIDEFSAFGFECSGTKTYVFKPGTFADNRESLVAHIRLLERLYDELIPELKSVARS